MRRYIKKNILSLLESMKEVHGIVSKTDDCGLKYQMLQDCQTAAIQIGQNIEQSEGTDTEAVKKLEKYCDLLYNASQAINGENNKDIFDQLNKLLDEIVSDVKQNIKNDKLEIVFLPYKTSMWDSFESIWMAAKDDVDCNTYVVPIPYYDRNPDGSLGEMHYEGDRLPGYVNITNWMMYDLEKKHPDIIYFHYPYDSSNYVTSIHPDFYSDNLKKYTEMMVYCPYFVSGMYPTENEFFSYIAAPGVMNADRIVVQSKNQYNLYLKLGYERERLLLLGSPKIDAYVNLKKENIQVPGEWTDKIQDRKVVILNSSIKDLLSNNTYMENLEITINKLLSKDGLVLIWRPHPLLKAAVKSMRPLWLEKYENIEQRVTGSSNAIYDTTPDPRIATVVSDGLISDISSWTRQYMCTGKPVLYISGSRKAFSNYVCTFDDTLAYFLDDGINIDSFCENILKNQDRDKKNRMRKLFTQIENMDGTCGLKTHQSIKKEFEFKVL